MSIIQFSIFSKYPTSLKNKARENVNISLRNTKTQLMLLQVSQHQKNNRRISVHSSRVNAGFASSRKKEASQRLEPRLETVRRAVKRRRQAALQHRAGPCKRSPPPKLRHEPSCTFAPLEAAASHVQTTLGKLGWWQPSRKAPAIYDAQVRCNGVLALSRAGEDATIH